MVPTYVESRTGSFTSVVTFPIPSVIVFSCLRYIVAVAEPLYPYIDTSILYTLDGMESKSTVSHSPVPPFVSSLSKEQPQTLLIAVVQVSNF